MMGKVGAELDVGGKGKEVCKDRSQVSLSDSLVNGNTIYRRKHINCGSDLMLKASTGSLDWQLQHRAWLF